MAPEAKSNITLICGLFFFSYYYWRTVVLLALRNAARWMDRLKGISLQVRPTSRHHSCTGQGAESCGPAACTTAPLTLSCASATGRGAACQWSAAGQKNLQGKGDGTCLVWSCCTVTRLSQGSLCLLLCFLHNSGSGRLRKHRAWAAVGYLKVMTNIWSFVLQGLTHLYKFWVRLPGVSPVASKELYLFTLAKNLVLYFLICPHLSPPPVALVLPGFFFCH